MLHLEIVLTYARSAITIIEGFSPEIIASLTGWDYILEALATVA